MELLGRLRRAVRKLTFLLSLTRYLTSSPWQLATLIRARTPAITWGPHLWRRRAYSFSDRPGLRECLEVVVDDDDHRHSPTSSYDDDPNYDAGDEDNGRRSDTSSGPTSPLTLRRTTSFRLEADVDKRAEMFIQNFYKHLFNEMQVSLNLRYCRLELDSSSFNTSTDNSSVSPLSSDSSQYVLPI